MARFTKVFRRKDDPQQSFNEIHQYLCGQGFQYGEFKGEMVFKRGKGFWTAPTIIKLTYQENIVVLETWLAYALLPGVYTDELGMKGFVGSAAKDRMKRCVVRITEILGGDAFALGPGEDRTPTQSEVQARAPKSAEMPAGKQVSKGEFRREYAPESFKKEMRAIGIFGYVLVGLNALLSILNPAAMVDVVIYFGLTLGMHLAKSKACAIAMLVYSILGTVIMLVLSGTLAGWMWYFVSIPGIIFINKVDKMYKAQQAAQQMQ